MDRNSAGALIVSVRGGPCSAPDTHLLALGFVGGVGGAFGNS